MAARETHQQSSRVSAKSAGRLAPGQAPPVGLENEERARVNLRAKLSVIEAWVKRILKQDHETTGEPVVPLALLPRSQNAFNAWSSDKLPDNISASVGEFHRNANSTLLKNKTILEDLRLYFDILKKAEQSDPAQKKRENVAGLHRRLAMEKTLRNIAEKALTRARAQAWKDREKLECLKAEAASAEAYAADLIARLEAMLQQVTSERAELARALRNVTGMKGVNR